MKYTLVLLLIFGLATTLTSAPSRAQNQNAVATAPTFQYEVASIRPNKPGNNGVSSGFSYSADGFTATGQTMQSLIQQVFEIQIDQLTGAPAWLNTERYDIDVKMDSSTADALQKLSLDDRETARGQMLMAHTLTHSCARKLLRIILLRKDGGCPYLWSGSL